jgi:hypothetical protein
MQRKCLISVKQKRKDNTEGSNEKQSMIGRKVEGFSLEIQKTDVGGVH